MNKILGIALVAMLLTGCLTWADWHTQNRPHVDPRQRPHFERPDPHDRDRETKPAYPDNGRDRIQGESNE